MTTSTLFAPARLFMVLIAFFSLTGCFTTTSLISPMEMPLNDQFNLADVDAAMQKAAVKMNWVLVKSGDGFLGTLKIRDHEAVVQFNRNKSAISAVYKSSSNLEYDGTNIHKKYHMWIGNYFKEVRNNLVPK